MKLFSKNNRIRDLMVARSDALTLAQADAARDAREWETAAQLYREFVALYPDRNGLLMQVGHCLKELGLCRSALIEYLAVSDPTEMAEAEFQASELLKLTGNFTAARRSYARSAAAGHAQASAELDRLLLGEAQIKRTFFLRTKERGASEDRMIDRLAALELAPFDWRRLAAAAEDAAVCGFTGYAELLADLVLIVGGPVGERRLPYQTIFGPSGLWGQRYAKLLSASEFMGLSAQDALRRLVDGLDFVDARKASREVKQPGSSQAELQVIEAGTTPGGDGHAGIAAAVATVRDRVFAPAGADPAELVAAIAALAAALPPGRPVYASLPENGEYALSATLRRVCLNVTGAVTERLAAPLRTPLGAPAKIAASFAIPTRRATLATSAAGDPVPAVVELEVQLEDPVARQQVFELTALGLLPGGAADASERLLALADQARRAPIEFWFAVSAPTAPASLVGEVAIRLANALKSRGALDECLVWTQRAAAAQPERFAMDLGIQLKTCGDFRGAVEAFVAVLQREPDHASAAHELNSVVRECCAPDEIANLVAEHPGFGTMYRANDEERRRRCSAVDRRTRPEDLTAVLDISDLRDTLDFGPERLEWHQLGWLRSEVGGRSTPRLVGVVAIRLCHITRDLPQRLRLRLDGRTIDVVEPSPAGIDVNGAGKYYFNSWIDTRNLPRGPAILQAYVEQKSSGYAANEEVVVIDELAPGEDYATSDAFVPSPDPGGSGTDLTQRVLAIPATAREAARTALGDVTSVLVMRLDQLGDLSASMPAIRRLREVFPAARFEGLVTPVNAYVLRATGLFDEIVTVDFPYDHGTRRRWLGRRDHDLLKQRYGSTPVDIAIDLSPGEDSRPILTLIKARYRAGFKPHRFGFLDFGMDLLTRDPVNRKEAVSHTAMIGAFVEGLATMFRPAPARFPADPTLARHLRPFRLTAGSYVAIHVGARLAIKRWPLQHYVALARLLRTELGRDIVMFSDDPVPKTVMTEIEAIGGIQVLAGRADFEIFDALIANAAVFIGNDTGPKHLAAMRGVRTVSVHMAQVNWNEWGQDGDGLIVSKRVPCCGCGIEDPTECGKELACLVSLTPRDLADAVIRVLG